MESKKEKVVNFGLTDELMDFLNEWNEKYIKKEEEKEENEEKPGLEVKRAIVAIAIKEVEKIRIGLEKVEKIRIGPEKEKIEDAEWCRLMGRLDKISDMIRWY